MSHSSLAVWNRLAAFWFVADSVCLKDTPSLSGDRVPISYNPQSVLFSNFKRDEPNGEIGTLTNQSTVL